MHMLLLRCTAAVALATGCGTRQIVHETGDDGSAGAADPTCGCADDGACRAGECLAPDDPSCSVLAPCDDPFVCDSVVDGTCRCSPIPGEWDRCAAACVDDDGCGPSQYCDDDSGHCRPSPMCLDDAACGPGTRCMVGPDEHPIVSTNGTWVLRMRYGECLVVGSAPLGASCESSTECESGSCDETTQRCVTPCRSNADCDATMRCVVDEWVPQCKPAGTSCPACEDPGSICGISGECRQVCRTGSDCRTGQCEGQWWDLHPQSPVCADGSECGADELLVEHWCLVHQPCWADAECGPDRTCVGAWGDESGPGYCGRAVEVGG